MNTKHKNPGQSYTEMKEYREWLKKQVKKTDRVVKQNKKFLQAWEQMKMLCYFIIWIYI